MTGNLFRCNRCGKTLIDEEYDNHRCSPKINGKIQVIEVDFWIRAKHPKTGEDLISTKALDGTTYWIVKRIPRPSDKVPYNLPLPPTESQQRKETPDKDNNTLIKKISSSAAFDLELALQKSA